MKILYFILFILLAACKSTNSTAVSQKTDIVADGGIYAGKIAALPISQQLSEYTFEIYNSSNYDFILSEFQHLSVDLNEGKRHQYYSNEIAIDYMLCDSLPVKSSCMVRVHLKNSFFKEKTGQMELSFKFINALNRQSSNLIVPLKYNLIDDTTSTKDMFVAENNVIADFALLSSDQADSLTVPIYFLKDIKNLEFYSKNKSGVLVNLFGCNQQQIFANHLCLLKIMLQGGKEFKDEIILKSEAGETSTVLMTIPVSNIIDKSKTPDLLNSQYPYIKVSVEGLTANGNKALSGNGTIEHPYIYSTNTGDDAKLIFTYKNTADFDLTSFGINSFFMVGYTVDTSDTNCAYAPNLGVLKAQSSCRLTLKAIHPDTPGLVSLSGVFVSAAPEVSFIDKDGFRVFQDNNLVYSQVMPAFIADLSVSKPEYNASNSRWHVVLNMSADSLNNNKNNTILFTVESPEGSVLFNSSDGAGKKDCKINLSKNKTCFVSFDAFYNPQISVLVKVTESGTNSLPLFLHNTVQLY